MKMFSLHPLQDTITEIAILRTLAPPNDVPQNLEGRSPNTLPEMVPDAIEDGLDLLLVKAQLFPFTLYLIHHFIHLEHLPRNQFHLTLATILPPLSLCWKKILVDLNVLNY